MSLIEKIDAEIEKLWADDDGQGSNTVPIIVLGLEKAKEIILSEQKEPCKGCQHDGEYENEVEYGYPSPCTQCKRRCSDNYLNQPVEREG
jgi:hypothetical protein